ncbi:MAG: hypothetical protein H0U45_04540 [Tatlockia sp.]|nr:hypothetical protein [Tatlockia sp.]
MNNVALVLALIMILGAGIALTSTPSYTTSHTIYTAPYTWHGGFIKQANDTTTETIKLEEAGIPLEEVSNRRLNTEVKLKVERGTVCLELLDNKGQLTTSVVSTPGKPALVRGDWFADASSVMKYRIIATEAENIEYSFEVSHRDGWSIEKIY